MIRVLYPLLFSSSFLLFIILFYIIYVITFILCSATTRLLILRNFFIHSVLFCPRVGNAAFWEIAEENKSLLTYLGTIFYI